MTRIRIAEIADAAAIAAIYNQGIEDRGATFETAPRSSSEIADRLRDQSHHPVLVATSDSGGVIGWAGLSGYRARACYAGIAEFSIYLDRASRGQGLGRQLLGALVELAAARGYSKLVSRIFTFNHASRALCRACGFREVGIYEKHGQLDGRWLDVIIVERCLPASGAQLPRPATATAPHSVSTVQGDPA